ncbi:MAG: hypothetical protein ACJ75J_07455 [Cytophagaceae bacterium]
MSGEENDLGKPPFFKTWRGMYIFVLINLAVTVLLFSLITFYFR